MDTPLLEDIVLAGVDLRLDDLQTSQVGIVRSFDSAKHTVDVQPIVKRTYTDEDGRDVEENQPVIPNVPVGYYGSGPHRIVMPIEKGSLVLLVHLSQSKDAWHYSKGNSPVTPGDTRRHALTDCVAIPGLLTVSGAVSPTALVKSGATVIYAPRLYLGGGLLTSPVVRKFDMLTVLVPLLTAAATALTNSGNVLGAAAVTAVAAQITTMANTMTTTVEAT